VTKTNSHKNQHCNFTYKYQTNDCRKPKKIIKAHLSRNEANKLKDKEKETKSAKRRKKQRVKKF